MTGSLSPALFIGGKEFFDPDTGDLHAGEIAVRRYHRVAEVDVVEFRTGEADIGKCRLGERQVLEEGAVERRADEDLGGAGLPGLDDHTAARIERLGGAAELAGQCLEAEGRAREPAPKSMSLASASPPTPICIRRVAGVQTIV